jgi:dTDP-glucose 4,6-dehydratase
LTIIENNCRNEIFNVAGGFEQSNIVTVEKILDIYFDKHIKDSKEYIDFNIVRPGHDVRYALNDNKLRNLGWMPKCDFDNEIIEIVKYYKENFIW